MTKLSTHLIKLRWAAGYTVARLADHAAVDKQKIEALERGSLDVGILDILAVFETLNADLVGLLTEQEHLTSVSPDLDSEDVFDDKMTLERVMWRRQQTSMRARQTRERARFLVAEHQRLMKLAQEAFAPFFHFKLSR